MTYSATSLHPGIRCDGSISREVCNDTSRLTVKHESCENEAANMEKTYAGLGSIYEHNVTLMLLIDVDDLER